MVDFSWKNEIKLNFVNFYEIPMVRPVADVGEIVVPVKDVLQK